MAEFSYSDINDAKRRVREMQRKAQGFVAAEQNEPPPREPQEKKKEETQPPQPAPALNLFDSLRSLTSGEDSGLLLALILILSREKADNMLILALLYILL